MKVAAVLLAWTGFLVHNFADLPGTSLFDPNTLYPSVVWVVLIAAWLARPGRFTVGVLLGWVALNLVGGGVLSVLPLPIWPFEPAQTFYHYAFHALYTATQIPATVVLVRAYPHPLRTVGRHLG
jgi:hypothetical protein